jgi:chemotaxis protein MotB
MENEPDVFEETESRLNKGAVWGLVYGDFMSYLMVFFLVMFSFALDKQQEGKAGLSNSLESIQQQFGGRISPERLAELTKRKQDREVSEELRGIIQKSNLSDQASVSVEKERVRLVLTSPVLFDSGKAELKAEAKNILSSVAEALKKMDGEVVVEGHTDNVPIHSRQFSSNWDLSVARANTVLKLLVESGIDPRRMTASGYGEFRPRSPNDTPRGQGQNRRIEVSLLRKGGGSA